MDRTLRALRPVEAGMVGAPALVGWLWAGGLAGDPWVGIAVAAGSWLLALSAFAWNDRADVVLGLAGFHRRGAVRDLDGEPSARTWLAGIGWGAAALGLACWAQAGVVPLVAAVVVATSALLYSSPAVFGKGRPLLAGVLHLVGGAANGFAGAAAVGDLSLALVWGVAWGVLFAGAHRVHLVAGRDEDRAADVPTAASCTSFGAAARVAQGLLFAAILVPLVAGLFVPGARGAALSLAASWMLLWTVPAAVPAARDRRTWATFQRRCRVIFGSGVAAGALWLALAADPPAEPTALDRSLSCLERHQRPDGTWPTHVRWGSDGEWTELHSVFTTAQVLMDLATLPADPRIDALAAPALDALEADRNDDGTWSFYGRADRIDARPDRAWDITPDADDTARAALALRAWDRPVSPATLDALAGQVRADGVVETWFAPPHLQKLTDTNRPDPVVAAVVARALAGTGRDEEVSRIRAHLSGVLDAGDLAETTYYEGTARIRHEIDLGLNHTRAGDPVPGWPAGEPGEDGCWPLQATFFGAAEAGRPAYGSVAEPTSAGLLQLRR